MNSDNVLVNDAIEELVVYPILLFVAYEARLNYPYNKLTISASLIFFELAMSSSGNKISIFPTRMALTTMKNRLKGAQTGHSLLKRKAEALTRRFREIVKKIKDAKIKMVL